MKPWREGWPGGKIRPHYTQSEKIKEKLGVGKENLGLFCKNQKWTKGRSDFPLKDEIHPPSVHPSTPSIFSPARR
jgi:hypothetical protein